MAELNSFSTGGAPGESGATENFSSNLSPAPYTRNTTPTANQPTLNEGEPGRPKVGSGVPGPTDSSLPSLDDMPSATFPPGYETSSLNPYSPSGFQAPPPAPQEVGGEEDTFVDESVGASAEPAGMGPESDAGPDDTAQQQRPISQKDVDLLPPGMSLDSPFGSVSRDADGQLQVQLNGAGQQVYDRLVVKETAKMGYYLGHDDPKAPKPPIIPGKPFLNPFTGRWTDGWDPQAELGGV